MQSSEYSKRNNKVFSIYVDGNTAIEIEQPDHKHDAQKDEEQRRLDAIRQQKKEGQRQRQHERALRRNKAMVCAAAVIGGAIICGVMILLLCSVITYNSLTNEIDSLSSQLDTLTLQNDSIEYDIDSAVDLNEIIDTATNDLGMVRGTSSVVVTYSDSESEYINQIAEVPTD